MASSLPGAWPISPSTYPRFKAALFPTGKSFLLAENRILPELGDRLLAVGVDRPDLLEPEDGLDLLGLLSFKFQGQHLALAGGELLDFRRKESGNFPLGRFLRRGRSRS